MNAKEAAEAERHTLLVQAAQQHANLIMTEMKRYQEDLAHIERVYKMRVGQEA